jgi:hypothetical protein
MRKGGGKERKYESEYGGNVMYSCMKMEKWELLKLFQEWGRGVKENDGGVNSTTIQCKKFGECHNVPPVQQ